MTNDDGRFPEGRLHTRDGTLSRRGLLRACAAALCLTGLPALLAGCAKPKAGRGDGDGPTTHEPQALGGSRAVGEKVEVRVGGGATVGVLDAAEGATGAVLMVGGMAGGLAGPSGVYPKLAGRFRKSAVTALRLDYREPGDLISCTEDVLAALGALGRGGTKEAVIVGWSFGGAVAIRAGVESDLVAGVATVSSQTGGTEEVKKLAPEKGLLLIHGTNDTTVVPASPATYTAMPQSPKSSFSTRETATLSRSTPKPCSRRSTLLPPSCYPMAPQGMLVVAKSPGPPNTRSVIRGDAPQTRSHVADSVGFLVKLHVLGCGSVRVVAGSKSTLGRSA